MFLKATFYDSINFRGDNVKFPEILKQLRNEKGLYQKELASILGVSRPTITQYENGTRTPDQNTLLEIAEYFSVSLDFLTGRTEERSSADKIKSALAGDPELAGAWDKLSKRPDLQLLFKQTKDMSPRGIKQVIRIIKAIEEEERERLSEE